MTVLLHGVPQRLPPGGWAGKKTLTRRHHPHRTTRRSSLLFLRESKGWVASGGFAQGTAAAVVPAVPAWRAITLSVLLRGDSTF